MPGYKMQMIIRTILLLQEIYTQRQPWNVLHTGDTYSLPFNDTDDYNHRDLYSMISAMIVNFWVIVW